MEAKTFYGLWNGKDAYWETFNGALFTEYLPIALGAFHNVKRKFERNHWPDLYHQVRQIGDDGLPTGEPLND